MGYFTRSRLQSQFINSVHGTSGALEDDFNLKEVSVKNCDPGNSGVGDLAKHDTETVNCPPLQTLLQGFSVVCTGVSQKQTCRLRQIDQLTTVTSCGCKK